MPHFEIDHAGPLPWLDIKAGIIRPAGTEGGMMDDTTGGLQELDRAQRGDVAPYVSGFTPWGPAASIERLAPGIVAVTTASHGGFWLSPQRTRLMPPALMATGGVGAPYEGAGGSSWWEEDCAVALVVLAFPEVFPPEQADPAREMVRLFWPETLARWEAL